MNQWQSEVGMTGEPSPNADLMKQVSDLLDKFEHNHDNITSCDSYFLVSEVKMGERIRKDLIADGGMVVVAQMNGCTQDICSSLTGFLLQNKDFIALLEFCCDQARHLLNEGL